MRRVRAFACVIAVVVVAACAPGEPDEPSGDVAGDQQPPTSDQQPPASDQQPPASDQQPPGPEGREAPDFTLDLADGSTFTLSAEQRATFLVFWAEW
jgi:hypothetical protein